jgi:hypothetical protein
MEEYICYMAIFQARSSATLSSFLKFQDHFGKY